MASPYRSRSLGSTAGTDRVPVPLVIVLMVVSLGRANRQSLTEQIQGSSYRLLQPWCPHEQPCHPRADRIVRRDGQATRGRTAKNRIAPIPQLLGTNIVRTVHGRGDEASAVLYGHRLVVLCPDLSVESCMLRCSGSTCSLLLLGHARTDSARQHHARLAIAQLCQLGRWKVRGVVALAVVLARLHGRYRMVGVFRADITEWMIASVLNSFWAGERSS